MRAQVLPSWVSAIRLDAPPGLTSDSPNWFLALSNFLHILDVFQCLLQHPWPTFRVQLLLGNPLCVVQFQCSLGILSCVRSCPEFFGARTHVRHWPTHPLVGSLVPAAHSWLSHPTGCRQKNFKNCKPQALSPSRHLTQRVLTAPAGVSKRIRQCGQACRQRLLASISHSIWSHLRNGLVPSRPLRMNDFASVIIASKTTIWRSPRSLHLNMIHTQPMHCAEPSNSSAHDQVQLLFCIWMRRLHDMLAAVPELSNLLPSSLSSLLVSQSQQNSWIGTA